MEDSRLLFLWQHWTEVMMVTSWQCSRDIYNQMHKARRITWALKPLQYLHLVLNTSSEDNDFSLLPFPNILKQSCTHGHNKGKINFTANRENSTNLKKEMLPLLQPCWHYFSRTYFILSGPFSARGQMCN